MNWLAFFQGAGGTFFDADGNLTVNNEAGVKSLSTMVGMLESGVAPESILTFRPNDARLLFQQERAVFLMGAGLRPGDAERGRLAGERCRPVHASAVLRGQ